MPAELIQRVDLHAPQMHFIHISSCADGHTARPRSAWFGLDFHEGYERDFEDRS